MSNLPPMLQTAIDDLVFGQRQPTGCPACARAEAQVDRLKAALDLEATARASMAEAAANAIEKLKAAEEKLKARDAFLRQVMEALESGEAADDTVWFNSHTTLYEAIEWLLDDPKARGERPLLEDVA